MHLSLSSLPPGHPLRKAPLRTMQAECRNIAREQPQAWRAVATWAIGPAAYDDLADSWRSHYEWRCTDPFSPQN